jgi:hypothetical protein
MSTFITPCILPDTDCVHQITPAIRWLSSSERKGGHPGNAFGYFLKEMERTNLFQIHENDESNIEHVPDWDSDSCLMLFDMAVEPAFPPNIERKRFRPVALKRLVPTLVFLQEATKRRYHWALTF